MKIIFTEYDGCFALDLEAENQKDAALLTRMGMNAREKLNHLSVAVRQDGQFSASIVFAKSRRANNIVVRRK